MSFYFLSSSTNRAALCRTRVHAKDRSGIKTANNRSHQSKDVETERLDDEKMLLDSMDESEEIKAMIKKKKMKKKTTAIESDGERGAFEVLEGENTSSFCRGEKTRATSTFYGEYQSD